jgi:pimeloyl-ACP methyl ester carboxylesterase
VGRSFLLGLVLGAVLLLLPGQARAAIALTPCPGATDGLQCGTVVVPLDRTGVVAGSVSLHVEVLPPSGVPRGTMFLIAGGPGQGSAHSYALGNSDTAEFMQAMLPGYTLVAFDNRGTGDSGLIDCPVLQATATATAEQGAVLARDCAGIIGPTRQFYATRDHAEDTDAVRAALGVQKIALFGVSYGTKLALAYALAHPGNVERLLLDSVVPTQFPDPFDRNVLREMPDTLARFCQNGTCRGATTNFAGEVVTLANRIEAKPISGRIIAPNGKLKTIRLNGEELLSMLIDTDLSPGLAAEAPAAVHAALRGNVRPLLRIYDMDLLTGELKAADLSFGLNAATNCADGLFQHVPERRLRPVRQVVGPYGHGLLLRAVAVALWTDAARARSAPQCARTRGERRLRPADPRRQCRQRRQPVPAGTLDRRPGCRSQRPHGGLFLLLAARGARVDSGAAVRAPTGCLPARAAAGQGRRHVPREAREANGEGDADHRRQDGAGG